MTQGKRRIAFSVDRKRRILPMAAPLRNHAASRYLRLMYNAALDRPAKESHRRCV
jgi:hypothetical protein